MSLYDTMKGVASIAQKIDNIELVAVLRSAGLCD